MKLKYFVPIQGLIGIRINEDDFKFSYGQAMPASTEEAYLAAKIRIDITYLPDSRFRELPRTATGKFHHFSGEPGGAKIDYDRAWFFGSRLGLTIAGATTNHVEIMANSSYRRFVKHRFMNLHSIGYIVTDVINLLLLKNGYCPLHCSAIAKNGDAYLIFAPPNTGKTITSMQLCMNDQRLDFVAEDLAVTDGDKLYAAPWTSTFRYYSNIDKSLGSRLLMRLTEKIAVLELLGVGKVDPITKYISKDRIANISKIKGLFILERGQTGFEDISCDEAAWRIHTLDRYEFNYARSPAIIAYEYFNYAGNIEQAIDAEQSKLLEMVRGADFTKIIRNRDAMEYADQIKEIID